MRLLALIFLLGCSKQPSESSPPHTTEASPPRADAAPLATTAAPSTAQPTAVAEAVDAGPPPKAEEPPPNVKVISIGMHVAGGPYEEETKQPFLKAAEPRYAELARCWKHVNDKSRGGDVGVELLIPPSGGKPKVSHPRSTVETAGEGFVPCVVAFFESIEFDKPKSGGLQGLSYSVPFKPGK